MPFSKIATNTTSGSSGFATLSGYTIAETAGAAAVVNIREASGGTVLWRINLAANESMGEQFSDPVTLLGVVANTTAFFFEVASGTVRWTAYGR